MPTRLDEKWDGLHPRTRRHIDDTSVRGAVNALLKTNEQVKAAEERLQTLKQRLEGQALGVFETSGRRVGYTDLSRLLGDCTDSHVHKMVARARARIEARTKAQRNGDQS